MNDGKVGAPFECSHTYIQFPRFEGSPAPTLAAEEAHLGLEYRH
ncbi:MAG: hypothetical protein WBX01_10570 [Nitrososphaeraceae archaeon]